MGQRVNNGTIFNIFRVMATIILFVYSAVDVFLVLFRLILFLKWEGLERIQHILTVLTSELLMTG